MEVMQKKPLVVGLAAGVVVIAALLVFMGTRSPADEPVTGVLFLVSMIKNDVFIKEASEADFKSISGETETLAGSVVKTSETGRSIVEGSDQSVTVVDRNSELTIASAEEGKTTMELEAGNAWSRVEKVFEQGEFYEMETTHAVATVRGTSFGTFSFEDRSEFMLTEGSIDMTLIDSETGERIPESQTRIEAPAKIVADSREGISVSELTDEDRQSEWYIFNVDEEAPSVREEEPVVETPAPQMPETVIGPPPRQEEPLPPPPAPSGNLKGVSPSEVVLGEDEGFVTVSGSGFDDAQEIRLNGITIPLTVFNDGEIRIFFSDIPGPGTFDITVKFKDGTSDELPNALTVEELPAALIELFQVVPNEVDISEQMEPVTVSLGGEHLDLVERVEVGGMSIKEFEIVNDSIIIFSSSEITQTGILDIVVWGGQLVASLPASLKAVDRGQEIF